MFSCGRVDSVVEVLYEMTGRNFYLFLLDLMLGFRFNLLISTKFILILGVFDLDLDSTQLNKSIFDRKLIYRFDL